MALEIKTLPEHLPWDARSTLFANGNHTFVGLDWPEGVSAAYQTRLLWRPALAPTLTLERDYAQDGDFERYRSAYRRQLAAHPEYWQPLLGNLGALTLWTVQRDLAHSHVSLLADWLEDEYAEQEPPSSPVCYRDLPP
ncbi:Hypothetical protein HDN1F_00440 [gamma proteobacterium HdN1]|nr:Hypothetical protein HDN1F_00440 [gamma proteobacterium HdN1]